MARFKLTMGDISTDIKQYNKAYIDDFSCTSQISTDASSVNYGVIPASGSATMRDINDAIKTDIESGALQYSGQKIGVYLNNGKIQELITDDSTYNIIDKTLNIDFTDRLSVLDNVTYGGMPLRDYSMTAYEMLDDVIGSYGGYVKTQVINWTKYFNRERFTIWSDANGIECNTAGGWEIIGTPIKVIPNKQYSLYYEISIAQDYTTAMPLQILNAPPTESNCEDLEIARVLLPTVYGDTISGQLSFTPTTDTVYLVLNFGYASDNQQIMIAVDRLNLDGKTLEKSTQNSAYVTNDSGSTWNGNITQLLSNIVIEHPYLEQASYRATIEKFCLLAQLTASLDDEGNFVFFDARPLRKSDEKALNVSRNYQISNLNKTLFVKNKFDGVDIKRYKLVKEEKNNVTLYSINDIDITGTSYSYSKSSPSGYQWIYKESGTGVASSERIGAERAFVIPRLLNNGLTQVIQVTDINVTVKGKHYIGTLGTDTAHTPTYTEEEETSWTIPLSKIYTTPPTAYTDTGSAGWKRIYPTYDKENDCFKIYYELGLNFEFGWIDGEADPDNIAEKYEGTSYSVTIVGDATEYSFEEVDLSTTNIKYANNVVSIPTNELMQSESRVVRIRDNIINDYSNGIPTATIDLFGNAKSGYEKGEIVQPNDILKFEDDDNLWRVTSRTLKYHGSPTVSLELQAQQEKQ